MTVGQCSLRDFAMSPGGPHPPVACSGSRRLGALAGPEAGGPDCAAAGTLSGSCPPGVRRMIPAMPATPPSFEQLLLAAAAARLAGVARP